MPDGSSIYRVGPFELVTSQRFDEVDTPQPG